MRKDNQLTLKQASSGQAGIREPSNLDVTKLVLTGQVLSQAKIALENSRFFWKNLTLNY